jgi:dihydroorotase
MRTLLKNARIIAPGQPLNGKQKDILLEDGKIIRVAKAIDSTADQVISAKNLHVSPGWMDIFANFWDPGFEYKEDLASGAQAAAKGGFTDVMVIPNTSPVLESKAQIEYITAKSASLPVTIHPIGAVSKGTDGRSLAEMYEMYRSGALAFSDGIHPVQSSGLLLKALQYIKAFGGILIQVPDDKDISHNGLMHEGLWSTRLGMPGKPAIAEEVLIKRDLDLLRYTGSKIHFTGVSTANALDLIQQARKEGLSVTCSVTPYHLLLTDESLQQYDSNYKVNPPLREQKDVVALTTAIKEGIVDCFSSYHIPQELDSKQKEFEYAEEGMIGLESCFGVLLKALPEVDLDRIIGMLSVTPRQLFGLEVPQVEEGVPANLTLFDPEVEWVFTEADIRSKSRNSPFLGQTLKGKPLGILHKHQFTPA